MLVCCAFVTIICALIVGVRTRHLGKIYPAAGLLAALLATAHSMIDFSWQIPGSAIVVFSLVGIGLAQCFATSEVRLLRPLLSENHEKEGSHELTLLQKRVSI